MNLDPYAQKDQKFNRGQHIEEEDDKWDPPVVDVQTLTCICSAQKSERIFEELMNIAANELGLKNPFGLLC